MNKRQIKKVIALLFGDFCEVYQFDKPDQLFDWVIKGLE